MDRGGLVKHLIATGFLKTPVIIGAFKKIDRKDFVRPSDGGEAYEDYPLPIGGGQTISQPTTVAFMLELLRPGEGERVLDVGSGSGWTTALLAYLVGGAGKVFGVERLPELVEFGRANLAKYSFKNAAIVQAGLPAMLRIASQAGDRLGLPAEAPFDKILVSAAAEEPPPELISQLKVGGVMVIPVAGAVLKIIKISAAKTKTERYEGFSFVPLVERV